MTGKHTLLGELSSIDAALRDGTATVEQARRGQALVALANASPRLLESLANLLPDIDSEINQRLESGIEEEWSELKRLSDDAHAAIREATGESERPVNVITIQIHRGLMTDVSGLSAGFELHVEDYDADDTSHPEWNAEKECAVTVYEGDTI